MSHRLNPGFVIQAAQEPLANVIAVSSSLIHAGFLSDHSCNWSSVSPAVCLVSSYFNAGSRDASEIFFEYVVNH